MKQEIGWKPHPGPQTAFFHSPAYEICYGGGLGGGKTDAIIMGTLGLNADKTASQITDPNYRGIIFRETLGQLKKHIIGRTKALYPHIGGSYNHTDHLWKFPSGAEIWLGYMQRDQDAEKYRGTPFQYMGFDEITYNSKYQYTLLKNWCRPTGDNQVCRVRSTAMPMGPFVNWVKEYFIDNGNYVLFKDPETGRVRQYIKALLDDNPTLTKRLPDYGDSLKALGPELYQALRNADWTKIIGAAFKELNQHDHMIPRIPFSEIPKEVRIIRFGDWGYSKPFSFAWCYIDWDGKIIVFHEWYAYGGEANKGLQMGSREVAKKIKEIDQQILSHQSPDNKIYGFLDAPAMADEGPDVLGNMELEGVQFEQCPRYPGSRIQGKQELHVRLSLANGGPHIKFTENLTHFWRTVPSLQVDDRKPEDVNTDGEDHWYDGLKGMLLSMPMVRSDNAVDEPMVEGIRDTAEMDW